MCSVYRAPTRAEEIANNDSSRVGGGSQKRERERSTELLYLKLKFYARVVVAVVLN